MSKKMANRILAAVLSLGAFAGSGNAAGAKEDPAQKSSNKESNRINEWKDKSLGAGKKFLNSVKEEFGFKDALYFLFGIKLYNATKRDQGTIDISSAVKYLEGAWLKSYIPFGSTEYIEFYGAEDVLFNFIRSSKNRKLADAVKHKLITAQINRIDNLLFAREAKVKKLETPTKENNNNNLNNNDELIIKDDEPKEEIIFDKETKLTNIEDKTKLKNLEDFEEKFEKVNCCFKTRDEVKAHSIVQLSDGSSLGYFNVSSEKLGDEIRLMTYSLLDDLDYLFKFSDEEIVSCISKDFITKLNYLAGNSDFVKQRIEPCLKNDHIKKWSSYVARIDKLDNLWRKNANLMKKN